MRKFFWTNSRFCHCLRGAASLARQSRSPCRPSPFGQPYFSPQSALHLPQRTAEKDGAGDPWLPRGPSAPTSLSRTEDISAEIAAYRRLSERERQVLRLVSQELTSQAAAERLGISKRMVDHQRTDALKKLSVRSPAAPFAQRSFSVSGRPPDGRRQALCRKALSFPFARGLRPNF